MSNENRHQLIQKKYFDGIDWCKNKDVYDFLSRSITGDIPIYLSTHSKQTQVFIASVLVPSDNINAHINELLKNPGCWNFDVTRGYGYGYSYADNQAVNPSLYPPFDDERPKILSNAIPIFFLRNNPLMKKNSAYIELNHQISQPHDLHYIDHLKSFIRLNELGDLDEIVKVIICDKGDLITFKDEVINFHCHLGQYTLLRLFDFTRHWENNGIELFSDNAEYWNNKSLMGRTGEEIGFCYLRGFQIIPNRMSENEFYNILLDKKRREYCFFLIHDWRNKRLVEWSSDPHKLGNYFVKSDLPFDISPAFFNREVLKRYKDDPDKYEIAHSTIGCRGSWVLRYSINDADQVCVYIKDLSYLPYKEQLHWKSYNENPKTGLSEIAIRRHFYGEWIDDKDPLLDLKKELTKDIVIDAETIWKSPDQSEIDKIFYLTADIQKEWEIDILIIRSVVIESFNEKAIRSLLKKKKMDLTGKADWRSLKLLEYYLTESNFNNIAIQQVMDPFFEINRIRSKISSHRTGKEAEVIIKNIKIKHGSFIEHQMAMIRQLLVSFRLLRQIPQIED